MLYFSVGLVLFLLGNALIVLSVIYLRFKSHGAVTLIDPVIGMTQKLSISKQPGILIGLILSFSFLTGFLLKLVYLVVVS